MSNDVLIHEFDQEMLSVFRRAFLEANYHAAILLRMFHEHGGLETARRLINSEIISDRYTALAERKRLDLTVEAMIHDNPKWHPLFTPEELAICKKRLTDYGYIKGAAAIPPNCTQ